MSAKCIGKSRAPVGTVDQDRLIGIYRGEMCRVNPFLKPVTLRFSKSLARLENEDHRKGGWRSFECSGAKK